MKTKLVIGAFVVATIAALVFSLGAFAQSPTGTAANGNNSNGCTLIDPLDDLAGANSTGNTGSTGSTGSTSTTAPVATSAATSAATSTPLATATSVATSTPMAAATSAATSAATVAPTATSAPSTGGSTGTSAATSTPLATATSSSSTGSTGSTGTTGSNVREPHETPFCANGFKADVAVPNGGSVSLSFANSGNSSSGLIPNTGSTSGSNGGVSNNNNAVTSVSGEGRTVKMNIFDANGGPVNAAHMEVCFNDPSLNGTIYQWYDANMWSTWYKSANTPARWVRVATTHTGNLACGQSWLSGTFTISSTTPSNP